MINDYFQIFFGSYGDSVILLKKDDFTIVDFNNQSMKMYDVPFEKKKEIIGKPFTVFQLSEFSFLKPEELNTILEKIKENGKWSVVLPTKTLKGIEFTAKTTISLLTYNCVDYLLIISEKLLDKLEDEESTKALLIKGSIRVKISEEANVMLEKEIINHKNTQLEYLKTQEFINSMINSSLDIILASDIDNKITHVSPSAFYLFGYSKEEFGSIQAADLYKNKAEYEAVQKQINTNGFFIGEITNKKKNGELFNTYLSASPIKNSTGDIIGLMGVSRDIEEIKKIESEIINSEKKYRELFENLSDAVLIVDENNNTVEINDAGKMLFETEDSVINNVYSLVSDDYKNVVIEKSKELKEKGIVKGLEIEIITKKGNKKNIDISSKAFYKDGIFKGSRDIIRDITEKKENDFLLIEQSSKIESIFENSSNVIIWTLDTDFSISSVNSEFIRVFSERMGKSIQKGSNFFKNFTENLTPDLIDLMEVYYNKARNGESQKFESIIFDSKGQKMIFETFLSPIKIEGQNKFGIACLAVDLTYKKETEIELRTLLSEKEVLLKEVHHRVKNNLQVISSILNLQSSYVKDQNTLDILRESQNRIKSMSFIHESLYRSDDFSYVNFSGYINSLASNLVQSYIIEHGDIHLELSLGDLNLNLDQAIPCGLIINELVSNSIKYAFPDKRQGNIRIELNQDKEKLYLSVSDNGIGLPSNFDVENTDTLGLQLVYTLISQLDGDIKVINKKGTTFLFNFTIQN